MYLKEKDISPKFAAFQSLNPVTSTSKAIFLRWKSFAAKRILAKTFFSTCQDRKRLLILHRSLMKLRHLEETHDCFLIQRFTADMKLMHKVSFPRSKNSLSKIIRRENMIRKDAIINGARNGPSFKKCLENHEKSIMKRISAEEEMIKKSFRFRSCLEFKDKLIKKPIAACMEILIEDPLSDEMGASNNVGSTHRTWVDVPPPSGFSLSEIWINMKPGQGIVGKSL